MEINLATHSHGPAQMENKTAWRVDFYSQTAANIEKEHRYHIYILTIRLAAAEKNDASEMRVHASHNPRAGLAHSAGKAEREQL